MTCQLFKNFFAKAEEVVNKPVDKITTKKLKFYTATIRVDYRMLSYGGTNSMPAIQASSCESAKEAAVLALTELIQHPKWDPTVSMTIEATTEVRSVVA